MTYPAILQQYGEFGFMEINNLLAFTGEKRATVIQTLHRWVKRGWLIPLRRGFYGFPENLAKNPLTTEQAANQLYPHSYVTGLWLINQAGHIPEGVTEVTSATLNNPTAFDTPLGRFSYQHLSPRGFFGYETLVNPAWGTLAIRVATPEKAILDFFWWRDLEWDAKEFARWRIQDPWHTLNHKRLHLFAKKWNQPRLIRAAARLTEYLNA